MAQDTLRHVPQDTVKETHKMGDVDNKLSDVLQDSLRAKTDSLLKTNIKGKVASPVLDTAHPKLKYNPKHALRWSLLPGGGQAYNQQYWKAPIMAGAFVGALTMTIKRKIDYNNYYGQYTTELVAIANGNNTMSNEDLADIRLQKQTALRDYNRWRIATAVVYGINLLDAYASAHIRNDRKFHSPIKAAYYSAILPGLGQAYNRKYWKIPIVYAGFAGTGYFIYTNGTNMQRFTEEYLSRTRPGYGATDPTLGSYSNETLLKIRGVYKQYYEISIIVASLWYILNILDATTDAHLHDFDVSDDLSWRVEPYFDMSGRGLASPISAVNGSGHSGLTWVWTF